ncbi:elongation factor 1-delta 1-like protein [Tanacetum coccineum]
MPAGTPPRDVIDVVARTIVTTMGAHRKKEPSSSEPAAAADEDDDNYVDLFGEDTKKKKTVEEHAVAVKASRKKKESGKSSILLDVKPWDDESDMQKLEEAVRSVQMEGLMWGACTITLFLNEIHLINIIPSCPYQLGFHLDDGWYGKLIYENIQLHTCTMEICCLGCKVIAMMTKTCLERVKWSKLEEIGFNATICAPHMRATCLQLLEKKLTLECML